MSVVRDIKREVRLRERRERGRVRDMKKEVRLREERSEGESVCLSVPLSRSVKKWLGFFQLPLNQRLEV